MQPEIARALLRKAITEGSAQIVEPPVRVIVWLNQEEGLYNWSVQGHKTGAVFAGGHSLQANASIAAAAAAFAEYSMHRCDELKEDVIEFDLFCLKIKKLGVDMPTEDAAVFFNCNYTPESAIYDYT